MKDANSDSIINDSIPNIAYNHKFRSILNSSIPDPKMLEKKQIHYINILYAIKNIPPCFTSTREYIKSQVDLYIKFIEELDYYKNSTFYKTGFMDGYNFLLEMQKQERNEKNK